MVDIWIKDSKGNPFIGQLWSGYTVWPDFFHPDSFDYWHQQVDAFLETVPIDGLCMNFIVAIILIGLDMNEVSNLCNGECNITKLSRTTLEFDPNNPPYAINNMGKQKPLDKHALAMDAMHAISLEYNVHNMFGMMESWATKEALEKIRNKRAFSTIHCSFDQLTCKLFHDPHFLHLAPTVRIGQEMCRPSSETCTIPFLIC